MRGCLDGRFGDVLRIPTDSEVGHVGAGRAQRRAEEQDRQFVDVGRRDDDPQSGEDGRSLRCGQPIHDRVTLGQRPSQQVGLETGRRPRGKNESGRSRAEEFLRVSRPQLLQRE